MCLNLSIGSLRLLETTTWIQLSTLLHTKLFLTSADVVHSFAIPNLAVKLDTIPGRFSICTLYSSISGFYYGQCSELCGSLHGLIPICIEFI